MTPELPDEIWVSIVKHAVTVWPNSIFNLLPDDFQCIEGFSKVSKFTKGIVDRLRHENVVLQDYDDFVFLCSPCQSIRYLRINETLPSRQMFTNTFYVTLSDYSQLISLSICSSEPEFTCSRLSDLSFATTLRRLDLRCKRGNDKTFWDVVTVSLPNVLDLRLGASEFVEPESSSSSDETRTVRERPYTTVEAFSTNLANRLSSSPDLRRLSLHITLNDGQSGNDYFGLFYENTTIRNECVATTALAQALPNLETVFWSNPWVEEGKGEARQRRFRIVRTENGIELVRDDQVNDVRPSKSEGGLNIIHSSSGRGTFHCRAFIE